MSITARPSSTFTAILTGAPNALGSTLTCGIRSLPDGVMVSAATTTGIVETDVGATSNYVATRTAPTDPAGAYEIVWLVSGVENATEDLHVSTSAPVGGYTGDLTDLDSVRQFMQKGDLGEIEQDDLILDLISKASRAIQRYTRVIAPAVTGSYTFTYRGRGMLSLSPYFCRNVTAVAMAGDVPGLSTATPLTSGSYSLEPEPAEDGVYTHLRFPGSQLFESNLELLDVSYANAIQQKVKVTGNWGYASVPEDVQHWANVTIVEWIRKDVSSYSLAFNANEDRLDRPEEIPFAAKRGLRQYRRDDAAALPTLAAPKPRAAEAI